MYKQQIVDKVSRCVKEVYPHAELKDSYSSRIIFDVSRTKRNEDDIVMLYGILRQEFPPDTIHISTINYRWSMGLWIEHVLRYKCPACHQTAVFTEVRNDGIIMCSKCEAITDIQLNLLIPSK